VQSVDYILIGLVGLNVELASLEGFFGIQVVKLLPVEGLGRWLG